MPKKQVILFVDGAEGRECSFCGTWKPWSGYYKKTSAKTGHTSRCKMCAKVEKQDYYAKNKDLFSIRSKEWRKRNKNYDKERKREYYRNNKTKHVLSCKKWRWANPDKTKIYKQVRRARKRSLVNDLTNEQYNEILEYFNGGCALTGNTENIEMEHAIPISVGHGGTTFGNVYPLSNGLNQSKGNRNLFEWFDENLQRLNLSIDKFEHLVEWLSKANNMTTEEYKEYVYSCHENPRTELEYGEKPEAR